MPPKVNPESLTIDQKVKQAILGLKSERWKTRYAAAKALSMSYKTLTRRINGGKSHSEARETQQKLTKAEEKVLGSWITHLTTVGHPARYEFIRDMVEEIRWQWGTEIRASEALPLGVTWVQRFIACNPYLKTVISRSIEAACIKDVTPDAVAHSFETLTTCLNDYQIILENVYNMDETGISVHYYETNCRFCNRSSSNFICCC